MGEFALVAETEVDKQSELERLKKEVAKVREEMERHTRKLSNDDFLRKAPQAVIDLTRGKQAELAGKLEKLSAELSRLGG